MCGARGHKVGTVVVEIQRVGADHRSYGAFLWFWFWHYLARSLHSYLLVGGFRRLNVRQPVQLCKETAAGTLPVTSYESTTKTLPLRYESIAEIYATYNQTPGLDH